MAHKGRPATRGKTKQVTYRLRTSVLRVLVADARLLGLPATHLLEQRILLPYAKPTR